MARQSAFSVKIDVTALKGLAGKLAGVTPERMGQTVVAVLNESVDSAYELGRKRILRGINLTDEYVQRKMRVEHATSDHPEAAIVAPGSKGFLTGLSHYGSMQETKPVNWTNARIQALGHTFADWPGWTKRTGDPLRGIAPDRKAAGRSVEVVKGRRKTITPAFTMNKRDSDGNPIVFRRTGGSIEALYGPSVYQLFRAAIPEIQGQVADDLQQNLYAAAEQMLQDELS